MTNNPTMDFRLKLEISLKETSEDTKGITIEDVYGDDTKGLDLDFNIVKSYEPTPQASRITIYNLSTETYNLIYEKADAFRLSCARGKDQEYSSFYIGYPVRAKKIAKSTVLTSNQGFMAQDANAGRAGQNDLQTNITLMNYGYAKLFKSYQAGVSTEVVIKDCMEAFGLPKGNMDNFTNVNLPVGFTIRGDVSQALTQLGNRLGFYWNTNDMQFNIYDKNRGDMKTYGIVLTPENSATPERQDDKFKARIKTIQKANKKKKATGIKATSVERITQGFKIRTQLIPHLICGSTIYLKDFGYADAEGEQYVYKIEHHGNNYGAECYTDIYCTVGDT